MRTILKIIFRKYRNHFEDFFVEDLIGNIPQETNDEVLKFLLTGKEKLDKWFRWQAYLTQRQISQPVKNPAIYQGFLIYIRTFQTMIRKYEMEKKIYGEKLVSAPKYDVDKDLNAVDEFFKMNEKAEEPNK